MNSLLFLTSLLAILGIFIAPRKFFAKNTTQSQRQCEWKSGQMQHNLTLVAALYDIDREKWPNFSRKPTQYHQEMRNVLRLIEIGQSVLYCHLLKPFGDMFFDVVDRVWEAMIQLPIPMVIFTDSKNHAFVADTRREFDLEHITSLHLLPLQKLPMYRHRSKIEKIQQDELSNAQKWDSEWDPVMKTTPEVFSPDYVVLVNSKVDFLKMALEKNHFRTEFFAWIDAGFSRLQPDKWARPGAYDWYPRFPKNQITMLKRTTAADKVARYQLKDLYHKDIPEVINAGLIGGDNVSIHQFHDYFYQTVESLLNQNMSEDEQVIFVLLAGKHPKLFNLIERYCGADLNDVGDQCLTQGDAFELLDRCC